MTSFDKPNGAESGVGEPIGPQKSYRLQQKEKQGIVGSSSVLGWLGFWFAIALLIRFTNLASKPAWMDEVSTVMFSLGNSSRFIPTNQVIDLSQILVGLSPRPEATAIDAASYLLQENNHPPAYFVVAHWWMQLFHTLRGNPEASPYASLWAARALPAFFGALAVPATYILGWLSFRDERSQQDSSVDLSAKARSIGLVCAAVMAVSPYSVFLSQEARHYTLAILMTIASLSCFALAVKAVWPASHGSLSWLTVMLWVAINTLSIAVHYFCGIGICAEGLVLLMLLVHQCRTTVDGTANRTIARWRQAPWIKVYAAAAGSLAGGLIWLPILLNFYGSPQTTYIKATSRSWKFWVDPIVQSIVGWLYALLAPITSGFGWQRVTAIVVTTLILLIAYTPWLVRAVKRGLQHTWAQPALKPGLLSIGGFFVMSNVLFFAICYVVGFDITRGHRYAFVYFPGTVVLAGIGLSPFWQNTAKLSQVKLPFVKRLIGGRTFVMVAIAVGFLGTQVITYDMTHLKFYEPDRFVHQIRQTSVHPAVVGIEAVVGDQPSVIGNEIVSVAWEVQRQLEAGTETSQIETGQWVAEPQFTIVVRDPAVPNNTKRQLAENLDILPRPFDLWLLNISPDLDDIQCSQPPDNRGTTGSFRFTHYICEVP